MAKVYACKDKLTGKPLYIVKTIFEGKRYIEFFDKLYEADKCRQMLHLLNA